MGMVEESSVQMKDGSSLNEETASISTTTSSLRLFILAPVKFVWFLFTLTLVNRPLDLNVHIKDMCHLYSGMQYCTAPS